MSPAILPPSGRKAPAHDHGVRELRAGQRIVFIVGLHRSATSLLARSLATHPEVAGFHDTGVPEDEGQHLHRVFPSDQHYGGPGKFGFVTASRRTESSALARPETRQALLEAWAPHWDMARPVLLEKSPAHLLQTRFLQTLFPEAVFVAILRHPVAVSFATQKWTHQTLHGLLRHWLVCMEALREDRPHLTSFHALHYERFIRDPEGVVAELQHLLGLPPREAGVRIDAGSNRRYLSRWERRRASPLTRPYIHWLIRRFEEQVRPYGYSLDDLDHLRPIEAFG